MKLNTLITILIIAAICSVCYYYLNYLPDKKFESEFRYGVVTISGFDFPADGGEVAEIYYYVNNKRYKSIINMTYNDKVNYKVGTKLYIKYSPKDPNIFKLVDDIKVPDTLKTIPTNGWDSIPN